MAKRFIDTEIWDKEWFADLSIKQKALVFYLFTHCDCAGVYDANYRNLNFYLGEKITENDILNIKQVEKLENGKFFITDFINFQYGAEIENLNEQFSVHKGIIKILEKNKIIEYDAKASSYKKIATVTKELSNSYNVTAQYKDKDKDKNKDKDNKNKDEKKSFGEFNNVLLKDEEYAKLQALYKDRLEQGIEKLSSYIQASGKRYKSHYAVLGKFNWVYRSVFEGNNEKASNYKTKDKASILREAGDIF